MQPSGIHTRNDFVSRFSLRTADGEQLSDQTNMVIVELSKLNEALKKPVKKLTSFEKWSLFFQFSSNPVYKKVIAESIQKNAKITFCIEFLAIIPSTESVKARKMYTINQIQGTAFSVPISF